jgi:hypothetical protein
MNIYALYVRNGNRAGFWVQHRSWSNLCAYVGLVAGQESGSLPASPPLHEQAPVQIHAFDVRSGRPAPPSTYPFDPGDAGFASIAEPPWAHPALRVLRRHPPGATAALP